MEVWILLDHSLIQVEFLECLIGVVWDSLETGISQWTRHIPCYKGQFIDQTFAEIKYFHLSTLEVSFISFHHTIKI